MYISTLFIIAKNQKQSRYFEWQMIRENDVLHTVKNHIRKAQVLALMLLIALRGGKHKKYSVIICHSLV